MLSQLFHGIEKILLPYHCVLCHEKANDRDLCAACALELPPIQKHKSCQQCAMPLNGETTERCGACQKNPPAYDRTIALFYYQEPITHMLRQFKFHDKLLYGKLFSTLLIEKINIELPAEDLPELLLPIPLHASRLSERGYNQALELAKPLAKALKIKLNYRDLIRTRSTQQQATTEKEERYTNVKGAFSLDKTLTAQHVALIDDVITTGHTVNECAKILKHQGIKKVTVFSVARTDTK
jgi:ComF family protein